MMLQILLDVEVMQRDSGYQTRHIKNPLATKCVCAYLDMEAYLVDLITKVYDQNSISHCAAT
jgi:hypothetical protein